MATVGLPPGPVDERLEQSTLEAGSAIPPHPLGIKPSGNAYTAEHDLCQAAGTFSHLPDELAMQILEHLDAVSLVRFGLTCKAMYCFASFEDLWKTLVIETKTPAEPWTWHGTWRNTFLRLPVSETRYPSCSNLFSDLLYRPFFCSHTPLEPYTTRIPRQNSIPRLEDLTPADFGSTWTDKPFILTKPVRQWPVYKSWSLPTLVEQYGHVAFRAEAVDWPLKEYARYMDNSHDESPLYLFDRSFVDKMSLNVESSNADYWVPECFGEDLFAKLKNLRPDDRWLIVGPERSGSTFHKDPNATSAWNAVIRGAKYWIMFPSSKDNPPPPGVFVSEDQSEVTSPLSIAEWLLGFHAEARKTRGCMEGICGEGEVLHVPSGWWHLVVNLRPSVAITQNFIPQKHLGAALEFLRDKPDQVSGFRPEVKDPYQAFVDSLRDQPVMLQEALAEINHNRNKAKKRRWDGVVHGGEIGVAGQGNGFSFGFNSDETDESNDGDHGH